MALKRITPNLDNSKTLITGKNRDYVDLDLSFTPMPGGLVDGVRKGDIYKKKDVAAVTQSIKNILLTNHYEKPFDIEYGGNIRSFLFENKNNYSEPFVRNQVKDAIEKHEPRAIVENVLFYDDERQMIGRGAQTMSHFVRNSITITVEYRIETTGTIYSANVNMNRLR